jgi:hypothetical protein
MTNIVNNTINIPSIITSGGVLPVSITYIDASGPIGPSGTPIIITFTFPTSVGPMTLVRYSSSVGSGVVDIASQYPATGLSRTRDIPAFRGPNPASFTLTVTAGKTYRGTLTFP